MTSPTVLTDSEVTLRPWELTDASFMYGASQDPDIQRYNGPVPQSADAAAAVIADIVEAWRNFDLTGDPAGAAFVVCDEHTGESLGMCGVDQWSSGGAVQFGYWLDPSARGRGAATRAAALMTSWLFEIGARRVFVTIRPDNAASVAVADRLGFVGVSSESSSTDVENANALVRGVTREKWTRRAL